MTVKVSDQGRVRPVMTLSGFLGGSVESGPSGQVPTANGSNQVAWGSNVAIITSNGSNALLGPYVNFASGSNIHFTLDQGPLPQQSYPSNTLRIHAVPTGTWSGPISIDNAANGDFLARIKKSTDSQYRLELNLRFQGDPQILLGDGSTSPDIRIRRNATAQVKIDDNADGPVTQLNVGSLYVDDIGGGEFNFKVDHTTGRVTIGGGGSSNLFTVGNQSSTQVTFIVGQQAVYIRGRTATSSSSLVDTQAVLGYYAYRWDGAASDEVTGSITFRSTSAGDGIWFFDVPGAEIVTIYGETGLVEIMGDQGADVGLRLITTGHALRAHYSMESVRLGGASNTPDTRIRRSTTKTLIADDNAGGALTLFKVTGPLEITGNVGFYGTANAAKPTVTGSRGGNAALASLLTGLAGLGLITDSSSA